MGESNHAGAVASNAGDDFHLIWACKKLLQLLKPNSKLQAITVEGPAMEDAAILDDESKMYAIDLAEYYGGKDFDDAEQVVFSQLKYSAYQMEQPWTASNLCASSNKQGNNSIIRRLADTYLGFVQTQKNVEQKLVLKLVSNRSLQPNLSTHLNECISTLKKKRYTRTADLLKAISAECQIDIKKIYEASHLSSTTFIVFLQVLDFQDCGTEIRSIHKAEIVQQLANWSIANVRNRYNDLIMHLRDMMLPEKPQGFSMDKEYVLAALGTSNNELFPAPSKFDLPQHSYINRCKIGVLERYFAEAQSSPICLHATAGVGKTTFVNHLDEYLPVDSIAVYYDCYGGGAFLQSGEQRQLTEVAVTQICNTLAIECGSDWIIGRANKDYEYWRLLNERLTQAVHYVRELNSSAIIALVVDAADNSVIAAKEFGTDCFLNDLLRNQFPDGVRLIITTRTERIQTIPWNSEVSDVQLPAFDLSESSLHLRAAFSDATEEQCIEFHQLTGGNPRVQVYMLSNSKSTDEILLQMRPNGITLNTLFKGYINAVQMQYSPTIDLPTLFSALTNLPRPIPESILCELCDISAEALESISTE